MDTVRLEMVEPVTQPTAGVLIESAGKPARKELAMLGAAFKLFGMMVVLVGMIACVGILPIILLTRLAKKHPEGTVKGLKFVSWACQRLVK